MLMASGVFEETFKVNFRIPFVCFCFVWSLDHPNDTGGTVVQALVIGTTDGNIQIEKTGFSMMVITMLMMMFLFLILYIDKKKS